jgi:hypothetical protein
MGTVPAVSLGTIKETEGPIPVFAPPSTIVTEIRRQTSDVRRQNSFVE